MEHDRKYLDRLYCVHLPELSHGRRIVETTRQFRYIYTVKGFQKLVRVHKGFRSDRASIPRLLWPLLTPDEHDEEAVVHDYMYWAGVDRWTCDSVFREIMKYKGIKTWKRCVLFWGVRIGGWRAWNKYKRENDLSATGVPSC